MGNIKIRPILVGETLFYPISIFDAIVNPATRKTLTQTFAQLATVATTGSYTDLADKPTIPEATIVDSALSNSSENPVQNKVVQAALEGKVAKEAGKGLSQNDFTNALLAKLNGLENYDDTAIAARIQTLETWKNTMTGETADEIINTFKEIEDFLNGITGADTLTEMLNDLQTAVLSTVQGYGYQNATQVNTAIVNYLTNNSYVKSQDLASVATSGDYDDLNNKPTIPIVDSSLSSSSTNALQNKVVKENLDLKVDKTSGVVVGTASTADYDDVSGVIS